jgi:hypothetical protein
MVRRLGLGTAKVAIFFIGRKKFNKVVEKILTV